MDYTQKEQFWERLKSFVSNVEANCQMAEEEKGMIISICDSKIKKLEI